MTSLLHIRGERGARDEAVLDELRASGFEVRSDASAAGRREPFDVAVISPDVEAPLQVARTLRSDAPDAHIVFLTTPGKDEALRRELRLARIGTEWSIAPVEAPDAAADIVRQAVAVTERRRKLRTTLHRMNRRIGETVAAPRRVLLSDHFLASVLDQLSDAVVVFDKSGSVLAFNEAASRAFGEIRRGASFDEVLPEAATEAIRTASAAPRGEAQSFVKVGDSPSEYGVRATSLHDASGEMIGMAVVARDVTAIRNASKRRELVAAAVSVLASTLDAKTALQRLCDLLVEEFGEMAFADMLERDKVVRQAVAARDPGKLELMERTRTLRSPLGEPHPSLAAIRKGETVVNNDVSEEMLRSVAADEEHFRLLRQLDPTAFLTAPLRAGEQTIGAIIVARGGGLRFSEDEVATIQEIARQATTALQNIWSYHSAAEANRMKDEFLATISHELRTPMTSILGWAQMLRLSGVDAAVLRDGLTSIERSARAQAQLIDDLLDLSRMQMGKLQFRIRSFSLAEVVRAAVETIRPAAHARNVALTVDASREAVIAGDADRMQQVIWNLLSNAIKFSERGGRVRVALLLEHSVVKVVVADEGRGIDPDFLPYVFERFRQADNTTTRRFGGLGLGLTIVKQLVEMHGGTIAASSPGVGSGATFIVTLPLASVQIREETTEVPGGLVDLTSVRVLVVEDDLASAKLLTAVLERAGAKVRAVGSVPAALDALRNEIPDVLLSDIAMPDEDGLALIRAVRATLRIPAERLPAIALTAFTDVQLRVTVLGAGFQMFMTKPVEPEKLTEAVAAATKKRRV